MPSRARQNVDKLNSLTSVLEYGARGDGVTDDSAAIQAAIDATFAAGGGTVFIPQGTYLLGSSVNLKSNVAVVGEANSTTLKGSGSSSMILLRATTAYQFGSTLTLASNATQNAITITVTDASSISVGDIILISATIVPVSGNESYAWMTQVVGKSSNTLTIADPMPLTVATTDTYAVQKLTTKGIEKATVSNLRFDRGTNSGADTFGLAIYGGVDVDCSNLSFVNFGQSNRSGIVLYYCLHVYLEDIFTQQCGSAGVAAQNYNGCTGLRAQNLRSYDDDSFGILFQTCAYTQAQQLSCIRGADAVGGRGIKLASDLRGQYVGLIANNTAYTGLAISNGSTETQVSNVIAIGNGWFGGIGANDGVNIFGNSVRVRVANVLAHGNANQDISIQSNALNTYIDEISATNVADSGTGSVIIRSGMTAFANTWTGLQSFVNSTFTYTSISDIATNGQTGLQIVHKDGGGITRNSYVYVSSAHLWFQSAADIIFSPDGAEKARMFADGGLVMGSATGGNQGLGTINAVGVYDDGVLLTCYVLEAWLNGSIDVEAWDALVPDRHIPAVVTGMETGNPVEVEPARTEVRQHERARGFAGVAADRLDIDKFAAYLRANKRLPAFPGPEQWQDLYAGKMATGDLIQRLWETVEVLAVHQVEARARELALEARIAALENNQP